MNATMQNAWSPYVIGAGLGVLEWFTFATADKGLGVTTPFETAAVLVQQQVAPERSQVNRFIKEREQPPAIDWEFGLAAGVAIGGWLVSRGGPAGPSVPPRWEARFGPSRAARYAAAFAGGALMMMGARTAKGCTSGHAITGTLQLAASSWLFSAVMGASAAAAAHLLFGRN
jgi:hypothetical protein